MNYGCQIWYGKISSIHIRIAHKNVIVESTIKNMATMRNFEVVYDKSNTGLNKTYILATSFPHKTTTILTYL